MGLWGAISGGSSTPVATVTRGTYASRPAAGTAGNLYFCTDSPMVFLDTGAAWVQHGPFFSYTAPPLVSTFSAVNAGGRTTTTTDSKGGILMVATDGANADDYRLIKKSTPGAAHTLIVHLLPSLEPLNYSGAGVCWRASSTGNAQFYGVIVNTNNAVLICRNESASGNGASPTFTTGTDLSSISLMNTASLGAGLWLKLADDGTTNRTFSVSTDGINWMVTATTGRTTTITPNEVGLWITPRATTGGTSTKATCFFDSFSLT